MEKGCQSQHNATPAEYSSPPCYAHEFPGYFGETAEPPLPLLPVSGNSCLTDIDAGEVAPEPHCEFRQPPGKAR